MITYSTKCDICGKQVEGWPHGEDGPAEWVSLQIEGTLISWNLCPSCWEIGLAAMKSGVKQP